MTTVYQPTHLLANVLKGWGGTLSVFDSASFSAKSELGEMALALSERYHQIDAGRLERATLAMSFYGDAIILSDDVIDYTSSAPEWAREVPKVGAYFIQACMLWAELFGADDPFWSALRRYHGEYLTTMRLEGDIFAGRIAWQACDEPTCLRIVRGKNSPIRAIAAMVTSLTRDRHSLEELEELTLGYFAASQMLDDVNDWREDVRDGNVSLLLRRTCADRPAISDIRAIGTRMFADGHVDYVLGSAQDQLAALIDRAERLELPRFARLLQRRFTQVSELAKALREDIAGQLERAGR